MTIRKKLLAYLLTACFVSPSALAWPQTVSAKALTSKSQARELALEKVKNGKVTDVDKDYKDGALFYEVELVKGAKKYDIKYRARDSKMVSYGWEKITVEPDSQKQLIGRSKCKKLALKKVKNGKIQGISKKTDDGIDIYKVKLTSGNKKYKLTYHARTGALIEYEWELTKTKSDDKDGYIGTAKAKKIALEQVPGATLTKIELDYDDGVPVYEVELVKGRYEYELKIHAKTGKVLEKDMDS